MTIFDLLASEIGLFFAEITQASSCNILLSNGECGWESGPTKGGFFLGLRLDHECLSEVFLGTMVVLAISELLKLLWHFPLELSSKAILWDKMEEDLSLEVPPR